MLVVRSGWTLQCGLKWNPGLGEPAEPLNKLSSVSFTLFHSLSLLSSPSSPSLFLPPSLMFQSDSNISVQILIGNFLVFLSTTFHSTTNIKEILKIIGLRSITGFWNLRVFKNLFPTNVNLELRELTFIELPLCTYSPLVMSHSLRQALVH